jgi:DNA-binding CsgD family transcriptional regulator
MDNEATSGLLILVIEFGRDGVRAAFLASIPGTVRADTVRADTVRADTVRADTVRADTVRDARRDGPEPPRPNWDSLTKRERIVAHLIGQALTNQQIASRIRVSPHTVNYHLRQIYRKLGINSRVELARLVAVTPLTGSAPRPSSSS